jgi:starch synthase
VKQKGKPQVNILFVAAEMHPFAKTGGLADVVGALPLALARRGHQVSLVLPAYPAALTAGIPCCRLPHRVPIPMGRTSLEAGVFAADVDGVTVWLLDLPSLYDRPTLYGPPSGGYPDNARRFAALCQGALAMTHALEFCPDIIHCHDWHAALLPALLRWRVPEPFFARTATVLTVHNLAFQGLFPAATRAELGLPADWLQVERAEFYGQLSFLKAGLQAAEKITTVSPTYRQETLQPAFGCGLDGVLRQRAADFSGILNGIDYAEWNPASDVRLAANYDRDSLAGKGQCKAALQERLGLPVAPDVPLLAVVSRLTEQKGCELLLEIMPRLATAPLQFALLGTGDAHFLEAFQAIAAEKAPNVALNLAFHPELGPLMYAGADMFLMPSRFEPCGISQLIALRYGAVPVVRRTGGLADTVEQASATAGNGFLFDDYASESFWRALQSALAAYQNRTGWHLLMQRGMAADHSWERSVGAYENIYREALQKRGGGKS